MAATAAADESQRWQTLSNKVFDAEGLTEGEKAVVWVELSKQDLSVVERTLVVQPQHLTAVLRTYIPGAPGAGASAGPPTPDTQALAQQVQQALAQQVQQALAQQVQQYHQQVQLHQQHVESKIDYLQMQLTLERGSIKTASQIGNLLTRDNSWQRDLVCTLGQVLGQNAVQDAGVFAGTLLKELQLQQLTTFQDLARAEQRERDDENAAARASKRPRSSSSSSTNRDEDPASSKAPVPPTITGEKEVQLAVGQLLRIVKRLAPLVVWQQHDTSASGLDGQTGKVDWSFSRAEVSNMPNPGLPQLLFMIELKDSLQGALAEAIGQLQDRAHHAFQHQLSSRKVMYAAAMGRDNLMLLRLRRGGTPEHKDAMPFALEPASEGLHLLLQLLLAAMSAHDYQAVDLQDMPKVSGAVLVDFQRTEAGFDQGATAERSAAQVWRASYQFEDGQKSGVAVKVSNKEAIEHEAKFLKQLEPHNIPGIVECVSSGSLAKPSDFADLQIGSWAPRHYLITKPYGRKLQLDDRVTVVLRAAKQVAEAIDRLELADVLHRDISLGNIILVEDAAGEEHARLIDFGTARELSALRRQSNPFVTGTALFMAVGVLRREGHSVSTDLESLFLVVLFLAMDGRVPWQHKRLASSGALDSKEAALLVPEAFQRRIEPQLRPGVEDAVKRLHALFYVAEGGPKYNTNITPAQFIAALSA